MEQRTRSAAATAALVLVVVLLVGTIVFFAWKLFFEAGSETETPQPELSEPAPEPLPEPEKPLAAPAASMEEPAPPAAHVEEHLYGELRLSYDRNALESAAEDPRSYVTLTPKGREVPRLDAQVLDAPGLGDSQRKLLAAGLLQAYYTDQPATEDVAVAPDPELEQCYVLDAPPMGDVPAMAARVRFIPAGTKKVWYLILLHPAGEEPEAALTEAFENAHIE